MEHGSNKGVRFMLRMDDYLASNLQQTSQRHVCEVGMPLIRAFRKHKERTNENYPF